MKSLLIVGAALTAPWCAFGAQVIDFQDQSLTADSHSNHPAFVSGGASFNNSYYAPYDSWAGFADSNEKDTTTAGYGNQYSAFPGGGSDANGNTVAGGIFALGYTSGFTPEITLGPTQSIPLSLRITNTTYAALSMTNGDSFAKKFGGSSGNDPDYFLLTITGFNAASNLTGTVNFYLADFRSANNTQDYIVNNWRNVDLTPLGTGVTRIDFALSSSDNGQYGMNTPAYFALDNLIVTPEPDATVLLSLGFLGFGAGRRRKKT